MQNRRRRIVIKFGTGILTRTEGDYLDMPQFRRLSAEIAALSKTNDCILVSSGAVGAGMMVLGLSKRPHELPEVQACAAIGQSRLMRLYQSLFARHKMHVAQLLLTHSDLDSRTRFNNARNCLNRLLAQKDVVPIINENDSVATEELRFGDNDRLSAEVSILAGADLLVLLTSASGLTQSGNPEDPPIPVVTDIDSVFSLASGATGPRSVGGMGTKLQAVKLALGSGIEVVIGSGRAPGVMAEAAAGNPAGTRFVVPDSLN